MVSVQLPLYIDQTKITAFIINTDHHYQLGEHWDSACWKFAYFNSFGLPTRYEEVTNFIERNSAR